LSITVEESNSHSKAQCQKICHFDRIQLYSMSEIRVENGALLLHNSYDSGLFWPQRRENPMPSTQLITVDETTIAHAQVLRGVLEAQGIRVWLNQESAGTAIGLNLASSLGLVKIIVNEQNAEQARALVEAYYAGDLQDETGEDQG
jgi:hypothetical protein